MMCFAFSFDHISLLVGRSHDLSGIDLDNVVHRGSPACLQYCLDTFHNYFLRAFQPQRNAGMDFLNPCLMMEDNDLGSQNLSSLGCWSHTHRQEKENNTLTMVVPEEEGLKMLLLNLGTTKILRN